MADPYPRSDVQEGNVSKVRFNRGRPHPNSYGLRARCL